MTDWQLRKTFSTTSGTVRWDRWGQDGGEPVVLLHGTPFSSFVWREVAQALARQYQVFLWDMPGYGTSEKHAGQDVSLDAQGRVFAELLERWELTEPAVVAHDFGGAVALRAHLLHKAAYRGLALVDPVALAPWGSPFFRLVGSNSEVFEQLPPALHRALVREYVRSASFAGLRPEVADRLTAPWSDDEEGQAAFYRQIAQADQRYTDEVQELYPGIELPVAVCWGAEDAWIPVSRGHELTSLIPGATLDVIPDAGHLVPLDAPAALTASLLAFLRRLS
ncbi:alpha/beta fold hydrolase [Streptomyces bacillaris]|uniref:alpha/beta fold hydrolase n=1 Tax=Streptomyces TaxID=1883 RepID=UPI0015866F11|nr:MULTISPECIES: alpha/beta hydrolase [Streptomyces]NUW25001.1 alpha/beta hydrolase [Streptomyces roseoviolaceus]MBH0245261.1 alpha/beta hydrolase [Streptomyces cavourensis]NUV44499.1 alpha/beta hydrolase [Streptomyces sp. CAI-24]NUV84530.1 alpha/beta hydrolase [Streptomyces sp. CAI-155]NUV90975.1 alpha/beta hydrolase [Streptomyces sp. KAI-26]